MRWRASSTSASVNSRVAFAASLLLVATVAVEAGLSRSASDAWAGVEAWIEGATVIARFPAGTAARNVDPLAFGLAVNGGEVKSPVLVEDALAANGTLRLRFLDGAGSEDSARLVAPREGPRVVDVALRVMTEPEALPSPRWGAPLASDGLVAYSFGGAVLTDSFAPDSFDAWVALRSIVRVDLATGEVRTEIAELPHGVVAGAAFWDARESPECPRGCAFVMGGAPSPAESSSDVLRFDPARGTVTTLASRLPVPLLDPAIVWTGSVALLLGGGSASVLQFDPLSGEMRDLGPSAPADVHSMVSAFDPRPTLACPQGCGYLFGGKGAPDPVAPTTTGAQQRDLILRVDVATGRVVALPARLPVAVEAPSVAWDGERAIVLGGRTCSPAGCARSDQAFAFDPVSLAVATLPSVDARPENAPALWHEGRVVIVTGKCGDGDCTLDRVVRYDPGASA